MKSSEHDLLRDSNDCMTDDFNLDDKAIQEAISRKIEANYLKVKQVEVQRSASSWKV